MVPKAFSGIIPSLHLSSQVFPGHQLSYEFYWEVKSRQDHEQYCQWYQTMAAQHRRELEQMRCDFNLLKWFYRGRW